MPNRRDQVAMNADEVRDFLANGRELVLVTYGPDGLPDPVPMWYVLDGDGHPVMRTYARSQKVRNVRRDPRCAALVTAGDRYDELRGVQLTGTVETFDDVDAILDVLAEVAVKYQGAARADLPAFKEAMREYAAKQAGLRVVADRVASWDHAKLGGRY
jgi:PPOX class probable F420-dependent enzyme